jgi:ankyrin repeat protein
MSKSISDLIDEGDFHGIKSALERDPSRVAENLGYDQPIHIAASENKAVIVELLIQNGADPNSPNQRLRTPLHLASELGPETVRVLLKYGAKPDCYDKDGYTPIAWAIEGSQREGRESVRLLLAAGARYGLLEAAAMGDLQSVRDILRRDPDAIAKEPSKKTLLSMACLVADDDNTEQAKDGERIVQLLLANNIPLSIETIENHAIAVETLGKMALGRILRGYAMARPVDRQIVIVSNHLYLNLDTSDAILHHRHRA